MNNKPFLTGMGMGVVAGSAIGMLVSPRPRRGKSTTARFLRNVGSVIDDVSAVLK